MSDNRNDTTELFDLNDLTNAVATDPRFAKLGPAIKQATSMSSVRNDLSRASEMIAACKESQGRIRAASGQGKTVSRADAVVTQALLMQAILLYTRAVHSKGKGRNKLQITNHLSTSGRRIHDQIVELRNRYLAHFGEPGRWERHRAVLALDIERGDMALSYPHESYYVRAEEARAFEALLAEANRIADEAYATAASRLNLQINRLFDDCPDFLNRLRQVPFNPESFFDADEIEGYLGSIGSRHPNAPTSPKIVAPDQGGVHGSRPSPR